MMTNSSILRIAITSATIAMILLASTAMAQTEVEATCEWAAPTTGSPVLLYVIEHSVIDGAWTQIATTSATTYTFMVSVGDSHRVRVAGVDADGDQGPFSLPSDPYIPDLGPPGQPGKPIIF